MVEMTVQELANVAGQRRRWHVVMQRGEESLVFTVNTTNPPNLEYMRKTIVAMIRVEDEEAEKTNQVDVCNARYGKSALALRAV